MSETFRPDSHNRDHLREQWRLAALEFNRLEDASSRLEEGRLTLLHRLTLEGTANGLPVTRAEREARTSDEYAAYVSAMHDARRQANDARVERDNCDRLYWANATSEAQQRAEMRLSR